MRRASRYCDDQREYREQYEADGNRQQEIAQARAGHEQHAEGRRAEHDGGAEVRLGEQQRARPADHEQRLHETIQARTELLRTPHGVARDIEQKTQPRRLRRL